MLTRFQPHKRDYSLKLGNLSLPARQKRSIYILAPRNLGLCSWLLNPALFLHLKGPGDSVSTLDALCLQTHSRWANQHQGCWLCFHQTLQCQICASHPLGHLDISPSSLETLQRCPPSKGQQGQTLSTMSTTSTTHSTDQLGKSTIYAFYARLFIGKPLQRDKLWLSSYRESFEHVIICSNWNHVQWANHRLSWKVPQQAGTNADCSGHLAGGRRES